MSGSLLTDFNDYHLKVGLQALHSLLLAAVDGFPAPLSAHADHDDGFAKALADEGDSLGHESDLPFPAPLSSSAHQDLGWVSRGEIVGGDYEFILEHDPVADFCDEEIPTEEPTAEESYQLNLERCLGRYALFEGTTKVFDSHSKKLMTKSAFSALVTPKLASEWLVHAKRRIIDSDAVKAATDAVAAKGAGEMMTRFVMLEGIQDIWDVVRRVRLPCATVKHNWAAQYDIWLKSDKKRVIWHEDLVFDPTQRCPAGQINMFDGLPLKPFEGKTQDQLLELCGGIRELLFELCERNDLIFGFVIKWLALPLQSQGTKMDSALLFHGPIQGAGKSLFFDKIMRKIYGKYSAKLGQGQLDSEYSGWKSQNLYTVFEEIFNPADRYGNMGKVKDLVTADTTRIEEKFVTGWEQSSHINFIFNSNEHQPLPIERNDRRFLVAWPMRKLPEQTRVKAVQEMESAEGIRAWYSYLLAVDTKGFYANTEPPMTSAKARIIRYGLHGWETFFDQWKDGYLRYPYGSCRTEQLYYAYRQWCTAKMEKILPENKFIELIASPDEIRADVVRQRCWYTHMQGRKQSMCFVIGQPPENQTKEQWLGACIAAFEQAKGGKEDVPEVIR